MEQDNSREEVLLLLIDIEKKKMMSSQGLSDLLLRYQFAPKQQRAFMTRLFSGTLEQQIYLDYVLNQFSKKEMGKQKPLIRCLLRMSLYQILFMDQVPDRAACNEAVKLARKKGFSNLSGFVNGILRNIIRKKDQIRMPEEEKDPLFYLSIRYSIPEWILKIWRKMYPYETVKKMAAASLEHPKVSVRVNQSKISVEEVIDSLKSQDVQVEKGAYLPYMLKISGFDSLDRLTAFREGFIQVQDESSAFVGHLANPKEDGVILDVCSAPGGKSLHLADILAQKGGTGRIIARDVSEKKTDLIEENIERCGFERIRTECFDGRQQDESWIRKADLVLLDVPCSGLGILARKNDIKYNSSPDKIKELVVLQRQIIKNAASYVKPGGILLLSTCTITPEENMENRAWILEHFPFEPEDFSMLMPEGMKEEGATEGYLQLLPGIHQTDGFFIAKFRRISDE